MATTTGIPAQVRMHRYFIIFYFLINHSAPSRCHDNSGADDNDTHARRNDNTTHDDTHEAKTRTPDATRRRHARTTRRDDDTHARREDTHTRRDDDGVHDADADDSAARVYFFFLFLVRFP
jgi:hypothetical protein